MTTRNLDSEGRSTLIQSFRLRAHEPVRVMYRVVRDYEGNLRSVGRIVWNGDDWSWVFGDGFHASEITGWRWTPEDFRHSRGMAWRVSGMGGADDNSDPISAEDALKILAEHDVEPDSIDHGRFPTDEEIEGFVERRPELAPE